MMKFKKYSDDELKHLQKILTMALKDIIEVLNKNNIPWYMDSGSAIGTVRHNGFIPWDDDVDICMFRKDYEIAIEILKSELDENKYYISDFINEESSVIRSGKVYLKGTYFPEWFSDYVDFETGIFVDIFPLDNVSDNNFYAKIHTYLRFLLEHIFSNNYLVVTDSKLINFSHKILYYFLKIVPVSFKKWKDLYYNLIIHYNDRETKRVCFLHNVFYERDDFEPAIKGNFEGLEVRLPKNNDKILTKIYGDYMQIPPEDKRFNHAPDYIDFGEY